MLFCKLTAETMSDEKHHTKECAKLSLAQSTHKELKLFL